MRMMTYYRLTLTCFLAVALGVVTCASVWAGQAAPKLELKMSQEKEVTTVVDGKKVVKRVPAEDIKQGNVVVYTVEYRNAGSGEARDAAIVDPVPSGAVYIPGSAEGKDATVTCSVDGGKVFRPEPVKITVKKADGSTQEKDAEPGMYTHIKWVVKKVLPGKSGKVSFKVTIK